ncbi:MAG: PASTA domain-containing protein, partial [Kordiimonadaceae bacterium]|nr:PASTA domain-containing protein [Kordiimonadaceae bacterium]
TAKATKQKGQDPFAGVATAMIMAGIPAVVAMQFPITDKAAVSFAGTFYPRIVSGYPVDAAVAEGRKAIKLADPSTMEWATPVLFMRSPDGVLFDIKKPIPAKPLPNPVSIPASNKTDGAAHNQKSQTPVTQKTGVSNAMKGLMGVAAVLALVAVMYDIWSSEATIPAIAEKRYSVSQATDIIKSARLMVAPDTLGVPSSEKKGVVLRTAPPEGTDYDTDKEVKLVVSNGTIKLESLEGKNEEEIRALFKNLPVTIEAVKNVVMLPADGIEEGTFVKSEPDANNIIPHDTAITLYMAATGIPVPDLVSLDLQQAIKALNDLELKHEIQYILKLDSKVGQIVETQPKADADIRLVASDTVMLVISARGGWVYLGKLGKAFKEGSVYENDSQARNMRDDNDISGKVIDTLKPHESVTVIKSRESGWTLVQATDQ